MPIGLSLRITDTKTNTHLDRVFSHFPVRIGRSTLNDLQISEGFISQFHAVIEVRGNDLMLRDLGSRNGTRLGSSRAPAHEPVSLGATGGEFSIGPLSFKSVLSEVAPQARRPVGQPPSDAFSQTRVLHEPAEMERTIAFTLPHDIAKARGGPQMPSPISREEPPDSEPPPSATLILPHDGPIAKAAMDQMLRQRQLESVALQAIQELAQFYLPGRVKLDSPEDISRFVSRVRDTLDVFLRSFVPLRDGYRHFASEMDIRKAAGNERPSGHFGVEEAQNEQELAQRLLDPADEDGASLRAVEGTFADLMIHQLALLNAIMRGVKSLLQELSPATIDGAHAELEKQGKTGFSWGPWRFKELWRIYGARHGDVDDGDKRTFAALFGRDFAEAYSQYRAPESGE